MSIDSEKIQTVFSSNWVNEEKTCCDLALERPYLTMRFESKCDAIDVLKWLQNQIALGRANAFVTVKDLSIFAERDPFVNGKSKCIKSADVVGWRYEDLKRDGYFDQTEDAFITRISLTRYSLALPGICDLRETHDTSKNEDKNSEPKEEDVITLALDEKSKKALMKFFDDVYEEIFGEDS